MTLETKESRQYLMSDHHFWKNFKNHSSSESLAVGAGRSTLKIRVSDTQHEAAQVVTGPGAPEETGGTGTCVQCL